MNSGKTIFSQLMEFLPIYEFRQCVGRYDFMSHEMEEPGFNIIFDHPHIVLCMPGYVKIDF